MTLLDDDVSVVPFQDSHRAILKSTRDAEMDRFLGPMSSEPSPAATVWVRSEMVGWIDYDIEQSWLTDRRVNVGYAIFAPHRGRNHATRALRLLADFLESQHPPVEPTLLIDPRNSPSLAVARKAGFERVDDRDGQELFTRPRRVPLTDAIAAAIASDPDSAHVTRGIHGTDSATDVAANIRAALAHAGLDVDDGHCRLHTASVGTVTSVQSNDGVDVVVKAYQPKWSAAFLSGVVDAQSRLADVGVACARPIAGPVPCGRGLATIETHLTDPGQPTEFGDRHRAASAHGLAMVIENLPVDDRLAGHPLDQRQPGALYPEPHSPLFDFDATGGGAEWIDELAALGRAHRDEQATVIAHSDWSARNVRLTSDGIAAIYDWDSLTSTSLPTALGQAAATWRALGESGEPEAPDLAEINAWIDDYPSRLSMVQRRGAIAAALWTLAYTARCEHAADPTEQHHRRARPTLRRDAPRYREALES